MFVLFSIAMVCFFALFGMMIILLHQAKAEGALQRPQRNRKPASNRFSRVSTSQDSPRTELDLNLSHLVPAKQPDWRYMVREGGRAQRAVNARSAATSSNIDRADLVFSRKELGDLTDPQANYIARRA